MVRWYKWIFQNLCIIISFSVCLVWITEARFHYVVERVPLREQSTAWERAQGSKGMEVPSAMAAWVGGGEAAITGTTNKTELETAKA
jgi:hypothetical protein